MPAMSTTASTRPGPGGSQESTIGVAKDEACDFDLVRHPAYDFSEIGKTTQRPLSRILVLGMGGGCDVFAAYALARHIARIHVDATVLYATTVGARQMGTCVQVSEFLWSAPPDIVPLVKGDEAYGSTRLEASCPRGPEGSPFLFVIPRHKGDLAELTAENVAAMVPAVRSLNVDLVIGVDNGGDSISGGVDWKVAPEAGRDMQVLHCLRASGTPFIHVVLGPGCDGETDESNMRACCAQLAAQGFLKGVFSISPLVKDMTDCCRTLRASRTPNIMGRALSGDMPSVTPPDGAAGDYVAIARHGSGVCLPREWMTLGLVIAYDASAPAGASPL